MASLLKFFSEFFNQAKAIFMRLLAGENIATENTTTPKIKLLNMLELLGQEYGSDKFAELVSCVNAVNEPHKSKRLSRSERLYWAVLLPRLAEFAERCYNQQMPLAQFSEISAKTATYIKSLEKSNSRAEANDLSIKVEVYLEQIEATIIKDSATNLNLPHKETVQTHTTAKSKQKVR